MHIGLWVNVVYSVIHVVPEYSSTPAYKDFCFLTTTETICETKLSEPELDENNISSAWLVLYNARIHKTEELNELISNTNHTLIFLQAYSQMMNPIIEMFCKVKLSARNLLSDPTNNLSLVEAIDEWLHEDAPGSALINGRDI